MLRSDTWNGPLPDWCDVPPLGISIPRMAPRAEERHGLSAVAFIVPSHGKLYGGRLRRRYEVPTYWMVRMDGTPNHGKL